MFVDSTHSFEIGLREIMLHHMETLSYCDDMGYGETVLKAG